MTSVSNVRHVRKLLWMQVAIGLMFVGGGLSFPIYMYLQYGFAAHPVYDGQGNVVGQASYFLTGLGMGLFAIAVASYVILMAIRSLRAMAVQQELEE